MHSPALGNDAPTLPAPPGLREGDLFAPRLSGWARWWPVQPLASASRNIEQARHDFSASLADLLGPGAQALRRRVEGTGSLRELWHLRPEVFKHIALHHSQIVAQRRVSQLNRHFPSHRSASGSMSLRP